MRYLLCLLLCPLWAIPALAMPFEMSSNKIYVLGKINDRGRAWFILDTGSVSNVIDTDRADSLGITHVGNTAVPGAGEGSLPSSIARNVVITLDSVRMPNKEVAVMPINRAIGYSEGRTIDGLLGCPFFNGFVVEIDYLAQQVNFIEPGKFDVLQENETIPFDIERGNIFVTANVTLANGQSVEGKFLVDTGWRSAVTFTTPFCHAQGLPGSTPTVSATSGIGIGGPVMARVGRIASLQLGKYRIENPFVEFSDTHKGVLAQGDIAGIIGAEILRRFRLIFDYQRRQMKLEPNARFNEPYDFDMSGIYVIAKGKGYKLFEAFKIIANSPASQAGICQGDLIEEIDKQPASNFTLETIRRMFRQEGTEYNLSVRRGGELLPIQLRLRRLI